MATCETNGHLVGHNGRCIMCGTPVQEAAELPERASPERLRENVAYWKNRARKAEADLRASVEERDAAREALQVVRAQQRGQCRRADAAEAERDRLREEVTHLKSERQRVADERDALYKERDRLLARIERLESDLSAVIRPRGSGQGQ